MGNKRFTDKSKWRNEWFRTLPMKAKLAWTYLCDECDYCGIWKADYGLASFQLDFTLTKENLKDWFGNKLNFFSDDQVLVLGFYEFQYGDSKDTWTAKVKARSYLENLGFIFINNKIQLPPTPHSTTLVVDSTPSVLIEGVGVVEGEVDIVVKEKELKKKSDEIQFMEVWNSLNFGLSKIKTLSTDRKRRIASRLKEASMDDWIYAMKKIGDSRFLCGENNSGWKIDFDWLIDNETNRLKIIEGKYESKPQNKSQLNEGYKHNESEDEVRKALGL